MPIVSISYDQNLPEKYFQDQLVKLLSKYTKVETEVRTKLGGIDILTENLIIEIKRYDNWHQSIGQLCKYRGGYPKHKAISFYFGVPYRIPNDEFYPILEAHKSAKILPYHHKKNFRDFLKYLKRYRQDPIFKDIPYTELEAIDF